MDKNDPRYKYYGMKNITVCERWTCFENFFNDIKKNARHEVMLSLEDVVKSAKYLLRNGIYTC